MSQLYRQARRLVGSRSQLATRQQRLGKQQEPTFLARKLGVPAGFEPRSHRIEGSDVPTGPRAHENGVILDAT